MPNFLPQPASARHPAPGAPEATRTAPAGSGSRLRLAALAVGAAALPVLAGCAASPGGGARQVASIPSSASSTGSAHAAVAGGSAGQAAGTQKFSLEGPTLPDNASAAEMKRIVNPWVFCLQAHGDHAVGAKPDGLLRLSGSISASARKACRPLQPHPPWQEIPADNPRYSQEFASWVNCMNARGVGVRAVPGGWNFTSRHEPADAGHVQVECEMRAFGEH